MMSQPRSPRQRPPFVVVSLADDLRGMEGWREGDEGGDREGAARFVCESVAVMYEAASVKRAAFAKNALVQILLRTENVFLLLILHLRR